MAGLREDATQLQVIADRRPAQLAHPRKLAQVHLPCSIVRIILEECGGDIVLRRDGPADLLTLSLRVCYTSFNAGTDHLKFKLGEDACHFQKSGGHDVKLSAAAINGYTPYDDQTVMLVLDDVDDCAQLLRAAGETGNFGADDSVAVLCGIQQQVKILFRLGVAVFSFGDDFFCACGFEFAYLSVEVLLPFSSARLHRAYP